MPQLQPGALTAAGFYSLAVPLILSRAGLAAMGIADSVMVAHFSPRELAALSLAEGLIGRLLDVFIAFLFGWLSLVPRYWARGESVRARRLWRRALAIGAGWGVLGAAAGWASPALLAALRQEPAVSASAAPVMLVLGVGFAPAMMAVASALYLEAIGSAALVAAAVIAANVLNVGLNWLLISGYGSLPALGALGSAWSTTVVRVLLAVGLTAAAAWRTQRADGGKGEAIEADAPADAWRLGFSGMSSVAVMVLLGSSLTVYAGWLGAMPLAAFSAALTMTGPLALIAVGMSDAAGIHVGSEAGRSGRSQAGRTAWGSLRLAAAAVGALVAVFLILRWPFAGAYTNDPDLRLALGAILPFAAAIVLVDSVGLVMGASLRSLKEAVWPMGIEIGSMLLIVPLAAALAFGWRWWPGQGTVGLVLAMLIVAVVRALCLTGRLIWCTRQ